MDGIYTKDRISINFSENEKKFSNEAVQIAKDGGKSNIKIMEASGAAFVLKEIGSATESGIQGNLYQAEDAKQKLVDTVMTTVSEFASDTANRITEEDSEELEENGMTLERYNAERLERLLEARKAMAALKERAIEGVREDSEKRHETAEKVGKKNSYEKETDPRRAEIAERLIEANLPVTQANLDSIAESMDLAEEAKSMTDASFSYLMNNKLQPTIENCYIAVHSGTGGKRIVTDAAFEELKPSIQKVAEDAEMAADGKLFAQARKLLENGTPVTKENLQYNAELNELSTILKDSSQKEMVDKALLDGAVENLRWYGNPKQTNIYTVIKREEVRLEMTALSSEKMKKLGIEPDLEALQKRIETLRREEKEDSKSMLDELEDAETAHVIFEETLESVNRVEKAGESLLGVSFTNRVSITLTQLSTIAVSISSAGMANAQAAVDSYEAAATEVRRDLGDSIGKAFEGIDETLKDLGFDTTEANRKAVRMLGYSSISITKEHVNEMKYYAESVQSLVDNLKPQTTAELIKRGINPLEISVRELSDAARDINNELGQTPEEKYSEYLIKLEKNKEISNEQRQSYIGIYRMLYQIEKTDGAAISSLVKSGRELTLKNLLTESRIRKNGRINARVNDSFGAAESLEREELTIDQQIRLGFERSNVERVSRKVSPERLYKLDESSKAEGRDFTELATEVLAQTLEEMPEGREDADYRAERLDAFRRTISQSVSEQEFLSTFAVETTGVALESAGALLNGHPYFSRFEKMVKEKAEKTETKAEKVAIEELPETEDELKEELETVRASVKELMTSLYANADLTGKEAEELCSMNKLIELGARLSNKRFYDIPLVEGEEITNLHLTIVENTQTQGSFLVTLPQGLRAEGNLDKSGLTLLISSESRQYSDEIKGNREELEKRLEAAGFEHVKLFLEQGSKRSGYLSPVEGGTKTDSLYRAAKETVAYLRSICRKLGE